MLLSQTGMDVFLDEDTGELSFGEGVACDGFSEKRLGQMDGLFASIEGCDPDALVYRAYRNVRRTCDDALWLPRDKRYDITVIQPGQANGEFFKTSGHYHALEDFSDAPSPELYEVLCGTVAFVLQHDEFFDTDVEGSPDEVRVVVAHAGESVVIPPFWGHGSINVGDDVAAFSNIAVVSCPVTYDAVKARHGLAVRVMAGEDGSGLGVSVSLAPNERYELNGDPYLARPLEAPGLGISFGVPCYGQYVSDPATYEWLDRVTANMIAMQYQTERA